MPYSTTKGDTMILFFLKKCNTYKKNSFKKSDFEDTPCPKCPAVGRFKLHGSYKRHIFYFLDGFLHYEYIAIKRVMCKSCNSTHAVMPGDLIPYKLLSLFVVMFILNACLIEEKPVLKVAEQNGFSFQFIYSCLHTFYMHQKNIHQYFKETSPANTANEKDRKSVMSLIKKPFLKFQNNYTEHNRRPCFMCKFFDGIGCPPVGIYTPLAAAT